MTQLLYLVTGGAGFLGINLCRYLLSRRCAVRSLDIAPFDYPERASVDAAQGDIRDQNAVDRAMAGVDIVVHCAAALPLSSKEDIMSTGVDATRIVLEGAMHHGASRVVYISSTAVYGIPDHHPLREDDKLDGVGPYGESKIKAEELCAQYRAKGLCVSVLRPKTFVGPERLGAFELLYDWAFEGRNFPVLGSGNNRFQLLDVDDLCRAIYLCATGDRDLVSDTFNVGAKEFGTMRDNFQSVLDHAGHGKKVIGFPVRPLIMVLKVLEFLQLSPLYKWIYETAAQESFVSTQHIETRLGFVPRYSNREALIRNYDWYVAHRAEFRGQSGTSHRVPWKKGILRLVKGFF